MGCDYYTYQSLEIDLNYSSSVFISLSRESGYFYELNVDEDDPQYEEKYKQHIQEQLQSSMKNILIYSDEKFILPKYDTKYRWMIEDKLKSCKKEWKDVRKITKIEYKIERE